MIDFGKISTENRNNKTINIDLMDTLEIIKLINLEDQKVALAIGEELPKVASVIDAGRQVINTGGRIIYIGSGTSGRLGILDAVECPPTFGVEDDLFIGIIAGGPEAFLKAQEGAEDNLLQAQKDLKAIKLCEKDLVIGIAASGRTPYVIGGIEYANKIGAKTASIAITKESEIAKIAQLNIEVVVGPEVITGSTRLKAGSAQKMLLNMISTSIMIKQGKVYENLMVDVKQTNLKLVERAKQIVMQATGCDYFLAQNALDLCEGHAKTAIVMILLNLNYTDAKKKLEKNNGFIRKII